MKRKILWLLIGAFLVRLIALNQSLWLDEATSAKVALHIPLLKIIPAFSVHDFHPPLYYWLIKLWTSIFGYTEIALRLPSVITSLITGYIVYLIGKRMKDKTTGLWAAAFFLFNPLIIYYSQEARMYMMTTLFLTLAFYQLQNSRFVKASRDKQNYINLGLFTLFNIMAFYTFYGSIFLIISFYGYLIYKRKYKELIYSLSVFLFSILLIFPLLVRQWINAKEVLHMVFYWKTVLGQANVKNLLLIPLKFTSGRISFIPKVLYYVIGGTWGIFVIWETIKGALQKKYLGLLLVMPIILGLFFSFFTPILQYFRFLYLLPLMSLTLAFGAKQRWDRIVIVVGLTFFSLIYLLVPTMHREDWKNLSMHIPTSSTVYIIPSSADVLSYYRPDVKIKDLRSIDRLISEQKELIVIPYTTEIYGFPYEKTLGSYGFKLQSKQAFVGGLDLERWSTR